MVKLLFAAFSYAWMLEPDPAFEQKFPHPAKRDTIEIKREVLATIDRYPELKNVNPLRARL